MNLRNFTCNFLSKPKFLILFLLFTNTALTAQINYEYLSKKTYKQRHLFLFDNIYNNQNIINDSVLFFTEVKKIEQIAKRDNDKELLLETEFMRFNFLSSRNYKNYLSEIKEYLQKVDDAKINHLRARTRQAIGFHYFYELKDFGEAYLYFGDSYPILQAIDDQDLPDKQELIYNIGYINYHTGYEFKAIGYFDEAEKLKNTYYPALACNIINAKGNIYQKSGQLDQAITQFTNGLDLSIKVNQPIWTQISINNLANVWLQQKNYYKALSLIDKGSDKDLDKLYGANADIYINQTNILAKILKELSLKDRFQQQINLLKSINISSVNSDEIKRDIYELLAYDQSSINNYRQAFVYNDSAIYYYKKIIEKKADQGIKIAVEKERIELLLQEQIKTEKEKKKALVIQIVMSLLLLIVLVGLGFLIKQMRRKFQKTKSILSEKLGQTNFKLDELLSDLKEKNKQVLAYEEELNQIYSTKGKDSVDFGEKQKTLNSLLLKPIITDANWIVFKRAFEQEFPEYFSVLQKNIPKITQAEIRYMYLRKMNLSPKEIAYSLGVSDGTIRQYRYRIRHKVGLNSEDNLDEFLEHIS